MYKMGSIIKQTLQKQIDRNNLQLYQSVIGRVLRYDHCSNTVTVEYPNPNGDGYLYRSNVTVTETLGNVVGSAVKPGMDCYLQFVNGNLMNPIIIGVCESNYEERKIKDSGGTVVILDKIEFPENLTPMTKNWLDEENEEKYKYELNELDDFTSINLADTMDDITNKIINFSKNESGLINTNTKSNIKFKENGEIDIFINNNIGVRISKNRIDLIGDVYVNGKRV